ncbi:MAG: lipopolysaccharide transport periplasmic protein LptA [Pseudomonadota bacterium]
MKKLITFALCGLTALSASAEKADAGKQAEILYNTAHADQVTQTSTLTGDVVVTKGTLLLRAEKAVLKQTPEQDMLVTLNAGGGKPATFRQKRDGGPDLWVEGEAQRIEYDERSAVVKLFGAAKIRQLEGSRTTDEIQSEFISYDSLREVFESRNDGAKGGATRSKMIIAPRKPRPAPPAAANPASAP